MPIIHHLFKKSRVNDRPRPSYLAALAAEARNSRAAYRRRRREEEADERGHSGPARGPRRTGPPRARR
ncbi:hypothetical protein GCM10010106_20490 [Thermopolyspora flexuosa]|uniref:Uncharacterized protein n=1 Tax=Thermopolyspora flexuosa TaxID=103836 RepID=A0A543J3G9_9ACTN|nr:hypothetical protein [Thermopolyspora flexuosa]TQM77369.1 hypothetical protein FHX40_4132 [Thermopolyspora flexuosa]GGM73919.1 hypothetical protein GCM10010106_20490 [Thermopolyspora flexuosa]